MKAVGVIVEYNPFHNGHAYHLEEAKKVAGADVAIAVMSGPFLQRGEPALISKWARTAMALKCGADIVFELPYSFATQHAETFASGAVSILHAAGCHSLCFGSESGEIESFDHTLTFLENEHERYQNLIQTHLKKGNSYPKAASLAYQDLSPDHELIDLSKPNNILGYQYMKAIHKQKADLNAFTVARKNADYHDQDFSSDSIASATSIRKVLFSDNDQADKVRQYVPDSTYRILLEYYHTYGIFHNWECYWPYLRFRLQQSTPEQLNQIYEMEEGLEHRILKAAANALSFQQFMENLKTKRYTWTRLQRICVHILTNTNKDEIQKKEEKASYLRLLGMTGHGREYLSRYKSDISLPIISRISSKQSKLLHLDIRAARIFAMAASGKGQQKLLEQDFTQPPIILP